MSQFVSLSVYCQESLCLYVYVLSVSLSVMSLSVMSMSVSLIVRKCICDVCFVLGGLFGWLLSVGVYWLGVLCCWFCFGVKSFVWLCCGVVCVCCNNIWTVFMYVSV
jgi:hypothetical protein